MVDLGEVLWVLQLQKTTCSIIFTPYKIIITCTFQEISPTMPLHFINTYLFKIYLANLSLITWWFRTSCIAYGELCQIKQSSHTFTLLKCSPTFDSYWILKLCDSTQNLLSPPVATAWVSSVSLEIEPYIRSYSYIYMWWSVMTFI